MYRTAEAINGALLFQQQNMSDNFKNGLIGEKVTFK